MLLYMPVVDCFKRFVACYLLQEAIDMLLTADSAVLYSGTALTIEEMEDFCQIDDSAAKVCIDTHPTGTNSAAELSYRPRERGRVHKASWLRNVSTRPLAPARARRCSFYDLPSYVQWLL